MYVVSLTWYEIHVDAMYLYANESALPIVVIQ